MREEHLKFDMLTYEEWYKYIPSHFIKGSTATGFSSTTLNCNNQFFCKCNNSFDENIISTWCASKNKDYDECKIGIRPCIKYSLIKNKINNKKIIDDRYFQVEYGIFPNMILDWRDLKDMTFVSEITFLNNLNSKIYKYSNDIFCLEYKNLPYIIEPIRWIVDKENDIAVTKDIIACGMTYEEAINYLNNQFSKDINGFKNIVFLENLSQMFTEEKQDLNNNKIKKLTVKEKKVEYKPVHLKDTSYEYGIYLTDKKYDINPAIGRKNEIRELEKSLLIPKKGVVLVGDTGVGKTAVVEGLAYNIRNGNVCELLKNKGIINVSVNDLLAGTKYRGDFEEKIKKLCENLIETQDVILFLDEIHTTIGVGTCNNQNLDLANMLKTYISNDLIKVIGCTTTKEYESLSSDPAFRRRFNIIEVKEPELSITQDILKQMINYYKNYYKIELNLSDLELNNLIKTIINLSKRKQKFVYDSIKNPDASINILISCFAYLQVENIKEAKFEDFINGIIDNKQLNLSKMEIENQLLSLENTNEEQQKDIFEIQKQKIKVYNYKK